jgi:hypothetical protein
VTRKPKPSEELCPLCGGETSFGYGFAGGGLGGYTFCLDCDTLLTKHRTDEGDCLNGILERAETDP